MSGANQADAGFPAIRSPIVESLFPPGASAAELRSPGSFEMLMAAEAAAIEHAVPRRAAEFAAGRLCARHALAHLGIQDFPLRAASDRQPVWPESVVGSITHTAGFCAAVVGDKRSFFGLGLDTEAADAVKPELWGSICVAAELDWIGSLPEAARSRAATLIFSAKEAFYKCQYPSTGEWMDFADLLITPHDWGAAHGAFAIAPTRPLALFTRQAGRSLGTEPRMLGAYRFHDEFVSAGVHLSAAEFEGGGQPSHDR